MSFNIGETRQFDGIYIANWEVSRFEIVTGKRFFGLLETVERCQLETEPAIETVIGKLFAGKLPDNWRHHDAVRFALSFVGCAVEKGYFGHMGWCRWRLRVQKWLSVEKL